MTVPGPPAQHLRPPTPAPSSPAESQLDGGEFFHEMDYQKASEAYSSYGGLDAGVGGEANLESEAEGEGDEELTEVWPEPKEDEHAYVAGEGGVRRRRTIHGVMNQNGQADGATKRQRIRFAPLRIPLRRRLQTLSVLWHELTLPLLLTLFYTSLINPLFWPLLLPYLLHLLLSTSHSNGSPPYIRSHYLRSLPIWKPEMNYIFGYQPHGIISIGAFGCFSTDDGVQGGVDGEGYACTPGGGFGRLFPGIKNTLLTLEGNFRVPFYREYLLAMGLGSVSKRSCEALLSGKYQDTIPRKDGVCEVWKKKWDGGNEEWTWRSILPYLNPMSWWAFVINLWVSLLASFVPKRLHPYLPRQPAAPGAPTTTPTTADGLTPPLPKGNAITIVLGGAHESLLTLPQTYRLILRKRRGFLRLALTNPNTALIPVLAFGENDLYETLVPERGTWLDKAQKGVKRWFGWTVPVFWARGVFNYDVGLVPFRAGVEVVCGRPVVPRRWRGGLERGMSGDKVKDIAEEEVVELQEEYIAELKMVWEEWKDVFAPGRRGELEIVE
ncbi:diacylglycerol acyltransferase-domain-containing protein [Terfezia claveryi]|nr:diacylglycerol acyltransferase-domain-containing protein [Terfezia claveryi]